MGSVHAFHCLPLLLTIGTVVPLDFRFVCTVTNNELIYRKTNFPTYKEHSSSSNHIRDFVNICICPEDYCGVKFGNVHFASHLNGVYLIRLKNPENFKMGRSIFYIECVVHVLRQCEFVIPIVNQLDAPVSQIYFIL